MCSLLYSRGSFKHLHKSSKQIWEDFGVKYDLGGIVNDRERGGERNYVVPRMVERHENRSIFELNIQFLY